MKLFELDNRISYKVSNKVKWKTSLRGAYSSIRFIDDNDITYAVIDGGAVGAFNNIENWGMVELPTKPSMEGITEAKQVWAKSGNKIVKKFRCTSGYRKGRIVSNPKQCNAPINIKKRQNFKKTKASLGGKMSRRASRTKRINPISIRLRKLNKR